MPTPMTTRTTFAVAAVAATSLMALAGTGQTAVAVSGRYLAPAATGSSDSMLEAVAVAPKSADAWAVINTIKTAPTYKTIYSVGHLHQGRWSKLAVQGRMKQVTDLRGIAAGSPKQIWAVGETLTAASIDTPVLEKSTGGAFKIVNLKGLGTSAHLAVVAASSAKNAWAIGELDSGASSYTLHWNGKKWTQKALTVNGSAFAPASLTTSSAKSAWAIGSDSAGEQIIHWNGKVWVVSETIPTGQSLEDIVTTGPHTWAVGSATGTTGSSALAVALVGSKWKTITLAHGASSLLESVSAVGKTAYAVGFTENLTGNSQHPVYAKLTGAKGKISAIAKENTFSATFDVAASSKTVVAVGSWEHTQCTSPTHPLAEQLVHSKWKLLTVPAKVAPASKTGTGICG